MRHMDSKESEAASPCKFSSQGGGAGAVVRIQGFIGSGSTP